MNLLIVDDEVIIVSLLRDNINWEGLKIDKVYVAYTAAEARGIICSEKVDIIICDIEMPQEDGLSLLKWVQQNYPESERIILTGYPDFKYAQDAISIGVLKYLLKPVSFDELSDAVLYASKQIQDRENTRKNRDTETLALDGRTKEKDIYTNLIAENILPFPEFISQSIKKVELDKAEIEPGVMVYLHLTRLTENSSYNSILVFALGNIAEELFPNVVEVHLWDNIFWVVKGTCSNQKLRSMCGLFMSKLREHLEGELFAYFTCDVSLETLAERSKSLRQAAIEYRIIGENIYDIDKLLEEAPALTEGGNTSTKDLVAKIQQYIREHYSDPLNRQIIESEFYVNADYANRVFKSATGYSLMQYLQYYRILEAKKLMIEGRYSITEIGSRVGYDNSSYFSKIFKKWTDSTPAEFQGKE